MAMDMAGPVVHSVVGQPDDAHWQPLQAAMHTYLNICGGARLQLACGTF